MNFQTVYVYDSESNFLGFSIFKPGSQKLHTANLWQDDPEQVADLKAQLDRLNDDYDVRAYWPDVRDPEVQVLINDPTWEPLTLRPTPVMDEDKSVIVWDVEPDDENPYGQMNEELSVIVEKTVMVPAPVEVQARIKLACETVARERAKGQNL